MTYIFRIGLCLLLCAAVQLRAMDAQPNEQVQQGHLKPVRCLSIIWSPDRTCIAAALKVCDEPGAAYDAIGVFDAKTHENIANLFSAKDGFVKGMPEDGNSGVAIHHIAYNKNAQHQNIAVARCDGKLYVLKAGLETLRWCQCPGKITSISWGQAELDSVEILAAASAPDDAHSESHVTLLRNVTQHYVGEIGGISHPIGLCAQPSVSMGNDGMYAVADSRHECVNIYNMWGEFQKSLATPHGFTPHAVVHTPAGDIIAAGQPLNEGGKNLYLFSKGYQLGGMPINFGNAQARYAQMSSLRLSIDASGTRVAFTDPHASENGEGSVWIYDLKTKELLAQFCTKELHHAALSPDGKEVAVGAAGGWSAQEIQVREQKPEDQAQQKFKKLSSCVVS